MMGYISKGHKRQVWCARGAGGQPPPAALQVLRVKVRVVELAVGGGMGGQTLSIRRRQHARADTTRLQTDRQIYLRLGKTVKGPHRNCGSIFSPQKLCNSRKSCIELMIKNSVVGWPSISPNNIKSRTKLTGKCLHQLNLKFILKKKNLKHSQLFHKFR